MLGVPLVDRSQYRNNYLALHIYYIFPLSLFHSMCFFFITFCLFFYTPIIHNYVYFTVDFQPILERQNVIHNLSVVICDEVYSQDYVWYVYDFLNQRARIQRGGGAGDPDPPLKITKISGVLAILVRIPLKTDKATKSTFNVGPSSALLYFGIWYLEPLNNYERTLITTEE